ncbi:MAG: Gfo/Idh/MocA family oxidoreductase [Acidobacteria bacterium]|nr:Gfo/Idh/MocA family oxidoreductase [Acidobacteriota bacterium]MBV9068122.1 Gfo/Idh/MocA family oxidoreductase [Acidobacteriota bacterium]
MARVGIIGTGWGARVQVPAFREAGLDVVAIAGHNSERTRKIGGDLDLEPFDDWRSLIASNIDLVTIVTPPSEHLQMATSALDAGKHVLCEKPTALNASEAEELVAAGRKHPDQIALIDHELRFLPSFRAARDRIGDLGGIRYAEVRYASPGRGDRTRAWNWWSDASQGGGIWGAVGSHFVDMLRFLGMEIEAVQATLRTIIDERPFENGTRRVTSDDFADVALRLANGAIASMTFSAVASGPDEPTTLTIHGEEGAMRLAGEDLLTALRGELFTAATKGSRSDRRGNSAGGAFGTGTFLLGRALKRAIDDGDRSAIADAATFEDGLMQQRVLDAARESSASDGRWTALSS